MRNKQMTETSTGAKPAQTDGEQAAFLSALNEARLDERKNQAVAMSARLEAIAAYLIKIKATGFGAVEVLRQEAERIQNEAWEIH